MRARTLDLVADDLLWARGRRSTLTVKRMLGEVSAEEADRGIAHAKAVEAAAKTALQTAANTTGTPLTFSLGAPGWDMVVYPVEDPEDG